MQQEKQEPPFFDFDLTLLRLRCLIGCDGHAIKHIMAYVLPPAPKWWLNVKDYLQFVDGQLMLSDPYGNRWPVCQLCYRGHNVRIKGLCIDTDACQSLYSATMDYYIITGRLISQ